MKSKLGLFIVMCSIVAACGRNSSAENSRSEYILLEANEALAASQYQTIGVLKFREDTSIYEFINFRKMEALYHFKREKVKEISSESKLDFKRIWTIYSERASVSVPEMYRQEIKDYIRSFHMNEEGNSFSKSEMILAMHLVFDEVVNLNLINVDT